MWRHVGLFRDRADFSGVDALEPRGARIEPGRASARRSRRGWRAVSILTRSAA